MHAVEPDEHSETPPATVRETDLIPRDEVRMGQAHLR
jgi:hypothetical protein